MGRDGGMGLGYAPVLADGFIVHIVRSDGGFCVIVAGELDASTGRALEHQIAAFVEAGAQAVLDLRDVVFMDASGLTALCAIRQRFIDAGGRLSLKACSAAVKRVLDAADLQLAFGVVEPVRRAP